MNILTECNLAQLVVDLQNGKTVVFPTETSYGLGCDATNQEAVDRIFKIKGRKSDKPLLVVVPNVEMAKRYLVWNELLEKIAKKYWPGSLTAVGAYCHPSSAEEGSASRPGEISLLASRWISAEHTVGDSRTIALRREMRKNPTEAEKILWNCLKRKQLGGIKFLRQHGIGSYIADFCQADTKIIIEVDGDIHFTDKEQEQKDRVREHWFKTRGYKILRYNNVDIFNNLEWILEEIYNEVTKSHPALPSAEGRDRMSPSMYGRHELAHGVVSPNNTLAIRVTANPLLQSITEKLGVPLVATSANISDTGDMYQSSAIIEMFKDRDPQPDIVLDYGVLPKRQPTTIVSVVNNTLKILRQGEVAITL